MIITQYYSKKPNWIILWKDISGLKLSAVNHCRLPKQQALGKWRIKYKTKRDN